MPMPGRFRRWSTERGQRRRRSPASAPQASAARSGRGCAPRGSGEVVQKPDDSEPGQEEEDQEGADRDPASGHSGQAASVHDDQNCSASLACGSSRPPAATSPTSARSTATGCFGSAARARPAPQLHPRCLHGLRHLTRTSVVPMSAPTQSACVVVVCSPTTSRNTTAFSDARERPSCARALDLPWVRVGTGSRCRVR